MRPQSRNGNVIAVKDKAEGNATKLVDIENKVKALIDDKQDEEDESLPEVENPISSEIAKKIEETDDADASSSFDNAELTEWSNSI